MVLFDFLLAAGAFVAGGLFWVPLTVWLKNKAAKAKADAIAAVQSDLKKL